MSVLSVVCEAPIHTQFHTIPALRGEIAAEYPKRDITPHSLRRFGIVAADMRFHTRVQALTDVPSAQGWW